MLNHFRPRETSWTFDNGQQAFTMTSLRALTGQQQVMDSYGKKCNSKVREAQRERRRGGEAERETQRQRP